MSKGTSDLYAALVKAALEETDNEEQAVALANKIWEEQQQHHPFLPTRQR